MSSKHEKIFRQAAQRLFGTHDGELVLAYLKDSYVETSALGETPEMTYFRLGQKELIQLLISMLKEPDKLDDVEVYNNLNEDL